MIRALLAALSALALGTTPGRPAVPASTTAISRLLFVGTYTGAQSRGIHAARFDDVTGALTVLGLAAETASPSFLEASRDGRFVFAVNEAAGTVTSFAVRASTPIPTLAALSVQPTGGGSPCHLALDRTDATWRSRTTRVATSRSFP